MPKKTFTTTLLAKVIFELTGYKLESMPQVRRDPIKPFCSALVKIDDSVNFKEIAQKLRYFKFDGCPCRSLPFSPKILESNSLNNILVSNIPKHIHSDKLEEAFKQYGEVLSAKI